ncbi:MAG: hypothetical protein IID39_10305, partial [Planctomycetes bacterium]|nr:hypothetical protein [Planctomycetota bacterium]
AGGDNPDEFTVELSGDGGSTWPVVARTVSATTDGWVIHRFRISDFPGLTGSLLRVRFSTADAPSDSLTEAAIDEFRVRAVFCSTTMGDFDGDGEVGLRDLHYLASCLVGPDAPYPDSGCAAFDSEPDGDVDLADVRAFQTVFLPPPE